MGESFSMELKTLQALHVCAVIKIVAWPHSVTNQDSFSRIPPKKYVTPIYIIIIILVCLENP